MTQTIKASDLPAMIGQDIPPSSWMEITQQRIDQFADATNDHQFIHVDPERASQTPFGGTIAHGFLTLSLLPYLMSENGLQVENARMVVNYGSNKVRYLKPVPSGSRVRAHQVIRNAEEKRPGQWLLTTRVTIEIENQPTPALIAEFLSLIFVDS